MLAALAGGVGAARFLRGLVRAVPPSETVAIVNTADDDVSTASTSAPTSTPSPTRSPGREHPEQGWGLAGETFATIDALDRYGADTWFRLGDRDLATHLYRTERLAAAAPLSPRSTREIAGGLGRRRPACSR